ncbi:MAG: FliA/WhiG family RNA polymerase sigma factor [Acidobacteriaceae bacterium]|nr:FliA/WhiG family RNA polymerase sigma factor [Acidobacteriaceae bacterium]
MRPVQESYSAAERERLILEHLPQVRWIAASIHERLPASVSLEDVVSTGIIGLIQAVDNFDASKNASLRTYAEFRIRGAILDSLRDLDGISVHKRKRTRIVQDAIVALEHKLGRSPSEDEIATQLGISVREYHHWLSDLQGVSLGSLDSFTAEGTDNGLISYLADPRQEDPGVSIERAELHALLAHGISCMPETERTILDLYYNRELTLGEIAKVLGVHLSRVSQIKVQAVLRLRSYLASKLSRRGKQQKGD